MCCSKFLKRIVTPELTDEELAKMKDNKKLASHLHNYTHGINSDPITLFAILFSAIIRTYCSVHFWLTTIERKSTYRTQSFPGGRLRTFCVILAI